MPVYVNQCFILTAMKRLYSRASRFEGRAINFAELLVRGHLCFNNVFVGPCNYKPSWFALNAKGEIKNIMCIYFYYNFFATFPGVI